MSDLTSIKAALVALLTPLPGFAGRVYAEHERLLTAAQLPCVVVRFSGARAEVSCAAHIDWTAGYEIVIYTAAEMAQEPQTAAEQLMESVLDALGRDTTLSGLVPPEIQFESITPSLENGANLIVRCLTIALSAALRRPVNRADGLDDFLHAHVDIDMASPRNDPQTPACPDGQLDAVADVFFTQEN